MMATARNLLESPSVTGIEAVPWAILAVALPSLIRFALDGAVVGVALTPYIPFVVLAALLLGWEYGTAIAIVSAAIADAMFIGPPNQFLEGPSDVVAVGFFLASSVMIVWLVRTMRKVLARWSPAGRSKDSPSGIVFSLEDGQAWASWYDGGAAISLGPQEEVTEMMHDFIAQIELGKRLAHI